MKKRKFQIGILGCGLIGKKRGSQLNGNEISAVYDPNQDRAKTLAEYFHCKQAISESDFFDNYKHDITIIAVTNNELARLAILAMKSGSNVLLEKPGAINLNQLIELKKVSKETNKKIKIGFNHRFHPAVLKAYELIQQGAVGELMYLRSSYGHGARLGYEKEWRNIPEVSGGGELLDQGVHILDLIYWIMGPLEIKHGFATTSYWNTMVEDNAVCILGDRKKWATFHVSCSEWKNMFSMEIYGKTGKLLINGLGGSYGKEKLTYYKMLPEMGPPTISEFEFDTQDLSWGLDLKNLENSIETNEPLLGDIDSAIYAIQTVKKVYNTNAYDQLPAAK